MSEIFSIPNGILVLAGALLAFIGKRYLGPYLKIEKKRRYAIWIAHLADEITDDLQARYPDKKWSRFLDEAVDRLMEICGIEKEIALRAINAALRRKKTALQP